MANIFPGKIAQNNRVKVLKVHKSMLSSVDEAGLVAYYNAQGFEKEDIETIIFQITEEEYAAIITGPTAGQEFNFNEDITITLQVSGL